MAHDTRRDATQVSIEDPTAKSFEQPHLLRLHDFLGPRMLGVEAVADRAVAAGGTVHAGKRSIQSQVVKEVHAEGVLDLILGLACRDGLAAFRKVHAEVARVAVRAGRAIAVEKPSRQHQPSNPPP